MDISEEQIALVLGRQLLQILALQNEVQTPKTVNLADDPWFKNQQALIKAVQELVPDKWEEIKTKARENLETKKAPE